MRRAYNRHKQSKEGTVMEYKYELHCHTGAVSRCGRVEPEKIVEMYVEAGYNGIVVTDH